MLVLSRKPGQRIIIDGQTVLEVIDFSRGKVRLGFTAPKSIRIDREEIHYRRAEGFEDKAHTAAVLSLDNPTI